MKLTIKATCHNLKQVTTFEGNVAEYQEAFGEGADPAKVNKAIEKTLSKMTRQMNGKIDLSAHWKEKNNED